MKLIKKIKQKLQKRREETSKEMLLLDRMIIILIIILITICFVKSQPSISKNYQTPTATTAVTSK